MYIMVQTGKKSLFAMKEKLHKMRLEIQELEEAIDDCETLDNRDTEYESRRYRDYNDYEDRDRERERDRDYERRPRTRY